MVTSNFRSDVETWPFRAWAVKNMHYNPYYMNSSIIVDSAMGQIPRISSYYYYCCYYLLSCSKSVFNRCVDGPSSSSAKSNNEDEAAAEADIDEERCDRDILMASHSTHHYLLYTIHRINPAFQLFAAILNKPLLLLSRHICGSLPITLYRRTVGTWDGHADMRPCTWDGSGNR